MPDIVVGDVLSQFLHENGPLWTGPHQAHLSLQNIDQLRNFIDSGVQLDAVISYDLLVTIFDPQTPLHDGAVIIREERIAAASVFLPLTKNPEISRELGTRHRAAIGITEGTDAISIVVSEETGLITWVEGGNVKRNLDTTQLRKLLLDAMEIPLIQPKREAAKTMSESESEITVG